MLSLSLALILSTFGIIFIAELPDKTALAAILLSSRHGARPVIIGAGFAMLLQTIIAVLAGGILNLLPAEPVRIVSGLSFIGFALFMFFQKEEEIEDEAADEVRHEKKNVPAWLASFLVLFGTEWGDLSQLAIAGIVAHQGHPLSVGIGAVLALWTVISIAALLGSRLTKLIPVSQMKTLSATLFALIGTVMLYAVFF